MEKYRCLAILVFASYFAACNQEKTAIVQTMERYTYYQGMYVGRTDSISGAWINYQTLVRDFEEDALIQLCEHANPVMRCYAFQALTEQCSPKAYDILLQHLTDTAAFDAAGSCFGYTDFVTNFFLEQVGFREQTWATYTLSAEQYHYLDSMLVYGDEMKQRTSYGSMRYPSRRLALQRINRSPQLHARLYELARDGVNEAIPILASYKNEQDTTLLKALLEHKAFGSRPYIQQYIRRAVVDFPHPAFYPILKQQLISEIGTNQISDYGDSFPLYLALAQYPTSETSTLFEKALAKSGDEWWQRAKMMRNAVQQYPSAPLNRFARLHIPEPSFEMAAE